MPTYLRVFAASLLLGLAACGGGHYTGTYVANHPYGPDTLVLRPDSTYTHAFHAKDGCTHQNVGTWSAWPMKEFNRLDIRNFDWHLPGHDAPVGRDTKQDSWPVEPERTIFNEHVLSIDADLGYYYKKVD